MRVRRWLIGTAALAALASVFGGCAGVQYYAQAVGGHLSLMHAARPIDERLQDSATPSDVKAQLARVLAIRAFATTELKLPDNGSYRSYADLGRPYAVWNVVAAEEFSIRPKESCFFFVGCVAYRGFYAERDAKAHAQTLRDQGLDVLDYGVAAYSTIGWFDDPVLNTFVKYPEAELARIIFHELSHQLVYTRDDSVFNESFAVAVEEEGVRRWLARQGKVAEQKAFDETRQRRKEFVALVQKYQKLLGEAYASDVAAEAKRADKKRLFTELRAEYDRLKRDRWGGATGYDRWFARELNNAHLASIATYGDLVPAFHALLAQHDGELPAFYGAVKELAALPKRQRTERLKALVPAERAQP